MQQGFLNPLSANPTKWSNTQTIRRKIADELFESVWSFYEIGAKRVNPPVKLFILIFKISITKVFSNNFTEIYRSTYREVFLKKVTSHSFKGIV